MRFLLKIVFWLALIAFFLPSFGDDDSQAVGVNYFGAFVGAQEALSDMGGFCERAPAACAAGRDVGTFVAARVTEGLAYGYSAIQGRSTEMAAAPSAPAPQTVESPAARAVRASAPAQEPTPRTAPAASAQVRAAPSREAAPARAQPADPMQTAAVAAERVRRAAGLEPFAMPGMGERAAPANDRRPGGFIHAGNARAIPLPTPRP